MALHEVVKITIRKECDKVLSINSPAIDQTAKLIAFYAAMLNTAKSDPVEDAEDQEDIVAYMQNILDEHIKTYQDLVGDLY